MFQIVRLLLRANTPGVVSPLGWEVCFPPSLFLCPITFAVCCAVTRKYDKVPQPKHVRLRHFLLGVMKLKDVFSVLLCLGCLHFYFCHFVFNRNFCDEICFTKNNKHSCLSCGSVLLQLVCCFWFNFISTALASRSVEGVVGSQLFLGSRPTQSALFPTRVFRNNRGVEKAPELQRVWR